MEKFDQTYSNKLIYVFSMPYDTHKGLLKVGEATIKTNVNPKDLFPNCSLLNQAAKKRIDSYTKTASISYKLLYTELASKIVGGFYSVSFSDKDVHQVLMNSGVHKVQPNGETGNEWFQTDLETVKAAIKAYKEGKDYITTVPGQIIQNQSPIDFREEQLDAIERTLKVFKKSNEMLWYAKMRFGKTLTALEVIRRSQYRRVIIVTHRPVVDDGWSDDFKKIFYPGHSEHDYHYERKSKDSAYTFDEKTDSENDLKICKLDKDETYFVYFASIQDLRGSQIVGGNFNKNNAVFALNWDLIVIDEAHEGTQTELGDNVIKTLRKDNTKVLALSGTPFNLLNQYREDNVYTWDYVMEQKKKYEWDSLHHGDHNPYADLPKMHIYTYDLGEKLREYISDDYETKAFNFREFFRVWTRNPANGKNLPDGAIEGRFVHEKDVLAFLDLLVKEDSESGYPFSTKEYRDMFKHTLWMVPGVKEARALSDLLHNHEDFKNFGIANVAGEGDNYEEEHTSDALKLVRNTINKYEYSITLSCGKLTTGVTVKEWVAVLMLSGTYSTSAAQYMQTIFRVQSAGSIDGKQKTDCYVFDFAPDRTLKVLTETVHLSRKPGKSQKKHREAMCEFLNYCPVISISGSKTRKYSVESMMEQIKQIYAERAVNSGFDDESIYNDELLKLNELDAKLFNKLNDIIGKTKAEKKKSEVVVNGQGLTDEDIENLDTPDPPEPNRERTPEEEERRKKQEQARAARKKAIDILRGISIRMPMLIYGAVVSIDEDISVEKFVELVDDASWKEFMPNGVTKDIFSDFIKYYDRDVFIAAGKKIRYIARQADNLDPEERVKKIASLFSCFKNPDKETVLTPWRVVNMHMSETIGGWDFWDENHEMTIEKARFVDQGEITQQVFKDPDTKILEINSKTGLYPLYVAYSVYREKLNELGDEVDRKDLWNQVLRENVFIICKTPMAKTITERTLAGYSGAKINAHCFDNLIDTLKNNPRQFTDEVLRPTFWGKEGQEMKFNVVVGNPPYQENISGARGNNSLSKQLFPYFVQTAIQMDADYVSMITPSRWFTGEAQDKSFVRLREFVKQHNHYRKIVNYRKNEDVFRGVEISGGVNYFLYDHKYTGYVEFVERTGDSEVVVNRPLFEDGLDVIISNHKFISILNKVRYSSDFKPMTSITQGRNAFGVVGKEDQLQRITTASKDATHTMIVRCAHEVIRYIDPSLIEKNREIAMHWKVFTSKGNGGAGLLSEEKQVQITGRPFIAEPNSVCTDSLIPIGCFDTENEARNLKKLLETRFCRFLIGILKTSQNLSQNVYAFVPVLDFDKEWTDRSLYKKYRLDHEEIGLIESMIKPM